MRRMICINSDQLECTWSQRTYYILQWWSTSLPGYVCGYLLESNVMTVVMTYDLWSTGIFFALGE